MAGLATDVSNRLNQLSSLRLGQERSWRRVAKLAAPDAGDFTFTAVTSPHLAGGHMASHSATRRSENIYDTTAVNAVDRLGSGLEALIVPQSEFWHNLDILDLAVEELSRDDRYYLQRLRNLMFKVRYDADSGWINAVQTALRRLVAFGNAFIWIDDNIGAKRALVRYKHIPLGECYVAEDAFGNIDTFYRHYTLTARQAVERFGERNCSAEIQRFASDPVEQDHPFRFVHAVMPRGDAGLRSEGVSKAKYQAIHMELEKNHICGTSGYFTFPVVDFRWLPEQGKVYGEGPVQRCLADIASLNQMGKHELVAFEQTVRPTLLMAQAGVMNRPNSNPGKVIHGGLNMQGQEMVKPMNTGARLDFGALLTETKRNQVKDSLYINLFQILVQNPQMSATEAMIRANEKGELLGPAGARIQQSLSKLVDRELDLLSRRGLYEQGSAFEVPETLQGLDVGPQFAGPISRLRQAKEVEGTLQLLNILNPLAQVNPEVVDRLDADGMVEGLADRLGVPVEFVLDDDAVKAVRENRQQQQEFAQSAAAAKDAASAGKDTAQALQLLQGAA